MKVSIVAATPEAERVICAAARGDYMDTSLIDVDVLDDHDDSFSDVMGDREVKDFITRLLRKGHYGPFEHASITFAVEGLSVACERQLTRHRFITFDVQSMRYVNFAKAGTVVPETVKEAGMDFNFLDHFDECVWLYERLVAEGVPKEDARMVLPLGTKLNLTMTMNLRTLMHFVDMRGKADAQWEIRELAEKCLDAAMEVAPNVIEAYENHSRGKGQLKP